MPQMSPINWFIMLIMFLSLMMTVNAKISLFSLNESSSVNIHKITNKTLSWLW